MPRPRPSTEKRVFGRGTTCGHAWISHDVAHQNSDFTTEALFGPVVARAHSGLRQRIGQTLYDEISAGVHAGWEAHLRERLTVASAKAVEWQFQVFRTARAAFTAPGVSGMDQTAAIRDFVGQPEKRLRQLYSEFPLLEHLCETLVHHWIDATEEFFRRLWADRERLSTWFGEADATQPAGGVEPGLSDPHRCGRTVARVRFDHGLTIIYKPRSLAPETRYSALLDFVNRLGCPQPLHSARSADRATYGWMEDVLARPCKTLIEVESFYWRAGALLGLVYLAGGVDMHRENMIAAGEHPVLIDLETFVHPQNEAGMEDHPGSHSLLRTGFLPTKSRTSSAPGYTNALWRKGQFSGGNYNLSHIPVVDGRHVTATDFTISVTDGFDWVGDALLRDCSITSRFADYLRTLRDGLCRRILRSSAVYGRILSELTSTRHLRQRALPISAIRQLATGLEFTLTEEEILSLSALDVPYFRQDDFDETSYSSHIELPTHEAYRAQRQLIIEALADQ